MGSSSSKSSSSTTYNNVDRRGVADNGSVLVTGDGTEVTVHSVDSDIVQKALDTVAGADATNADGFDKLLSLAGKLFDGAGQMVSDTQAATLSAYQTATAEKSGTIDNKTIMILGIAGAVAYAIGKAK